MHKRNRAGLSIRRLLPNVITVIGLCSGLTSIKYTFMGNWELAIMFVIIAALIDGLDGRVARILKSSSVFGAELDSLADFLNFGAAPAFLVYFWKLSHVKFGWAITTIYVICMSVRLARFNTLSKNQPTGKNFSYGFFMGVPAPMSAILCLTPIILTFDYCEPSSSFGICSLLKNQIVIDLYVLLISVCLVLNIPTFSVKKTRIPRDIIPFFLAGMGILIILLFTKPWIVIPLISLVYVLTIPMSAFLYFWLNRKY